MGLLEVIHEELDASEPAPRCRVGKLLAELSDADREELEAALGDPELPSPAIARALKRTFKPKKRIEPWTVQRHRRQACRCWREEAHDEPR